MRRFVVLALAVAISSLPGCRSEGVGRTASETLLPQAEGVRAAVDAGDLETAAQRLALLKIAALRLRQEGQLDQEAWQRVVRSADQVAAFLASESETQEGSQLRVPVEDLNGQGQQAPAGAAGGRDGDEGEEGEDGEKGRKGNRGNKGKKGDD